MPYRSERQRRFFNANREKLERQGVDVDEWNKKSKGKKLPEKAAAAQPQGMVYHPEQTPGVYLDPGYLDQQLQAFAAKVKTPADMAALEFIRTHEDLTRGVVEGTENPKTSYARVQAAQLTYQDRHGGPVYEISPAYQQFYQSIDPKAVIDPVAIAQQQAQAEQEQAAADQAAQASAAIKSVNMLPKKKQEKKAGIGLEAVLARTLTKSAGMPAKKEEVRSEDDKAHEAKETPAHEKAEHKPLKLKDGKLQQISGPQAEELAEEIHLPKKISLGQFRAGLKVEREHKDVVKGNEKTLARIAAAHLKEDPQYYKKLKKVEKHAEDKKEKEPAKSVPGMLLRAGAHEQAVHALAGKKSK